jgi:hypothetical protein
VDGAQPNESIVISWSFGKHRVIWVVKSSFLVQNLLSGLSRSNSGLTTLFAMGQWLVLHMVKLVCPLAIKHGNRNFFFVWDVNHKGRHFQLAT